jgi:hypothetical protein
VEEESARQVKIKIFYNGDHTKTRIENADTGELIEGVVAVDISIDSMDGGFAALTFQEFEVELDEIQVVDEDTGQS